MPKHLFDHVTDWVFDLDNTLYPPQARLFDRIEQRMTDFLMQRLGLDQAAASHLRHDYWHRYGTTLAGLMREHAMDPADYLVDVHDITLDHLTIDHDLVAYISALPGRKIVYTNGTASYATRVVAARGMTGLFDAIYGVEEANYLPKPETAAFEAIFARDGLDTSRAAMFEDDARNLKAPHAMGMRTVHVAPDGAAADHIHHHTDDLTGFLARLL